MCLSKFSFSKVYLSKQRLCCATNSIVSCCTKAFNCLKNHQTLLSYFDFQTTVKVFANNMTVGIKITIIELNYLMFCVNADPCHNQTCQKHATFSKGMFEYTHVCKCKTGYRGNGKNCVG